MANIAATQTSNKLDWETPQWLFDYLDKTFNFSLDACATEYNAKCHAYFDLSKGYDALKQEWSGTVWLNPPYGKEIGRWMTKAYTEACLGNCTVVCLVPARTDTRWWWNTARHGTVIFLKGRLKFEGASSGAPFPSAIVVFARGRGVATPQTHYLEVNPDDTPGRIFHLMRPLRY